MNGLNLETTRRLDRARKKGACLRQPITNGGIFGTKVHQCRAQFGIGQHRPFPQTLKQPVLHLAGGGLGVGQAENMLRFHPAQQQPRDAVGQNLGLARPGIGRKPSGGIGAGGAKLRLGRGIAAHVKSSGTGSELRSHSP